MITTSVHLNNRDNAATIGVKFTKFLRKAEKL
jgi:hypothetical protein